MTPVSFELERFERLPATETSALVRVAGRFGSMPDEPLAPIVLAVHRPDGASRFAPLPDPSGDSTEPQAGGGVWRAAFSVPVALSEATETAYALETGAGLSFELPLPLERPLREVGDRPTGTAASSMPSSSSPPPDDELLRARDIARKAVLELDDLRGQIEAREREADARAREAEARAATAEGDAQRRTAEQVANATEALESERLAVQTELARVRRSAAALESERAGLERARMEAERWVSEGAEVERRIVAARETLDAQRADLSRERKSLHGDQEQLARSREELDRDRDALRRDRQELANATAAREVEAPDGDEVRPELADARAEAEAERELRSVLERQLEAQLQEDRGGQETLERQAEELDRAWAAVERQMGEVAELQTRIAEARHTLAEVVAREELERVERARLEEELQARLEGEDPELASQLRGQQEALERLRLEAVHGAEQAAELERRIAQVGLTVRPEQQLDPGPGA